MKHLYHNCFFFIIQYFNKTIIPFPQFTKSIKLYICIYTYVVFFDICIYALCTSYVHENYILIQTIYVHHYQNSTTLNVLNVIMQYPPQEKEKFKCDCIFQQVLEYESNLALILSVDSSQFVVLLMLCINSSTLGFKVDKSRQFIKIYFPAYKLTQSKHVLETFKHHFISKSCCISHGTF